MRGRRYAVGCFTSLTGRIRTLRSNAKVFLCMVTQPTHPTPISIYHVTDLIGGLFFQSLPPIEAIYKFDTGTLGSISTENKSVNCTKKSNMQAYSFQRTNCHKLSYVLFFPSMQCCGSETLGSGMEKIWSRIQDPDPG
jgi:hypothetical protein